jgi:PIN domain nuclease of toxin-antitoxin system
MKILLDTCEFLWIASDSPRLSKAAAAALLDRNNERYLSSASAWEISIKYAASRLPFPERARKMLTSLMVIELGGQEIAIQAAKNFRALRVLGVTVRKIIDTVIATRCIESGYDLLHNDRDFDPFVKHLGLRVVT